MSATTIQLRLPTADGAISWPIRESPGSQQVLESPPVQPVRKAYAAPHVVADPMRSTPGGDVRLDLDTTLAYRRYLWSLGLGVADGMSTAERSDGVLPWPVMRELIDATADEARRAGGEVACGIGSDALIHGESLAEIRDEYLRELRYVEERGVAAIVRGGPRIVELASEFEDYRKVYAPVLEECGRPVIIHWVGEPFDPAFRHYWGAEPEEALRLVVSLAEEYQGSLDGIKFSLLDGDLERRLRRELPPEVRLYTGDDYHYVDLIEGDGAAHSDALLGVFDPIAPLAARAMSLLAGGDVEGYRSVLEPTVELSRTLFEPPARRFKTGTVFLAYINGHQNHFRMISGLEGGRSITHLSSLFMIADRIGLLRDPEDAALRFRPLLELSGVKQ